MIRTIPQDPLRLRERVLRAGFLLLLSMMVSAFVASAQVAVDDLEQRDDRYFEKDSTTPFSGQATTAGGAVGQIEDGLFEGDWSTHYASGAVETTATYEDGEQVLFTVFFEDGQRSSQMAFQGNVPHGLRRAWYPDGTLRQETPFVDGRPTGRSFIQYADGSLMYSTELEAGIREGETSWYYPDGTKRWETHFSNGERTGTWIQYDPDGGVVVESTWESGELTARVDPHAGH